MQIYETIYKGNPGLLFSYLNQGAGRLKIYFVGSYSTAEEGRTKVQSDAGEPDITDNDDLIDATKTLTI